ncbi:hypothetical protein [Oenococcus oeni]|uniref:hypothetical protein n=1 Tax=Oenococcus oeni TaxID=1247 RepID=UPI000277773A|nr:hypothetical protein [Oenococcus oeni]EJN92797.1 hypothetical protein AWRIB304_304 [Oenococcus oeni AWRIB304]EJO02044.1 hypothetical protein AWRIB318_564 [Oenococcus oeni AWRIB318]EKP89250.1 hypothetical protein AWRIB202_1370 [Oenococcus oeni AWRIB202]
MANIARKGTRVPVKRNPNAAVSQWLPAIWPSCTGKIKFPAPKNIPNIRDATKTVLFRFPFFNIFIFPSFSAIKKSTVAISAAGRFLKEYNHSAAHHFKINDEQYKSSSSLLNNNDQANDDL